MNKNKWSSEELEINMTLNEIESCFQRLNKLQFFNTYETRMFKEIKERTKGFRVLFQKLQATEATKFYKDLDLLVRDTPNKKLYGDYLKRDIWIVFQEAVFRTKDKLIGYCTGLDICHYKDNLEIDKEV